MGFYDCTMHNLPLHVLACQYKEVVHACCLCYNMHVAFTTTCMLLLILEKNTLLINRAASVFGLVICHVF